MPAVKLTILIGMHAHRWHLGDRSGRTLTEIVANWEQFWPDAIPLPHPSPRNALWLKKNPYVEAVLLPKLRRRIKRLLD
jgi:uracil-DNA glycosylase